VRRGAARLCASVLFAAIAVLLEPTASGQTARRNVILVSNELPSEFKLVRVRVAVDGAVRFDGLVTDPRAPLEAILPSGNHAIEVIADYRYEDAVFSYMKAFAFEMRSSHALVASSGHDVWLIAHVVPRGDALTPIARRARVAWTEAKR